MGRIVAMVRANNSANQDKAISIESSLAEIDSLKATSEITVAEALLMEAELYLDRAWCAGIAKAN